MLEVCTVDPVSKKFEFISQTVGAEGKLLFLDEYKYELKITSVPEKKILVTELTDSIQYTVSSEAFKSEESHVKYFKLFSVFYTKIVIASRYSGSIFKEIFSGC